MNHPDYDDEDEIEDDEPDLDDDGDRLPDLWTHPMY